VKAIYSTFILAALVAPFYAQATENTHPPSSGSANKAVTPSPGGSERPPVAPDGQVTQAVFTSAVINREPIDRLSSLTNDKTRVYYFTEIQNMAGQTVRHRWEYQGEIVLDYQFEIGTDSWRIYSVKTLDPEWVGEWKASAVDAAGSSLSVNTFTYLVQPNAEKNTSDNTVSRRAAGNASSDVAHKPPQHDR
jgi:hypothetical protein